MLFSIEPVRLRTVCRQADCDVTAGEQRRIDKIYADQRGRPPQRRANNRDTSKRVLDERKREAKRKARGLLQ